MKAENLLKNVEIKGVKNANLNEIYNLNISNVIDNFNNVGNNKNLCFVCINGFNFDSHILVKNLNINNVSLIISEKELETNIPYVIVKNSRSALSFIASNFYNNPSEKLKVIGIIGTNGKTSTTYLIKQLLNKQKIKCSLIGTSGVYINNKKLKETLTTPDPLLLNKLFSKMVKAKTEVVVLELSAHAISLNKVDFLFCDVLIFSNFSQDHLDFFKTMENYKNTKLSYFNKLHTKNAVINIDDNVGLELFNKLKAEKEINCYSYSIKNTSNVKAENVSLSLNNTKFNLKLFNEEYKIKTKVLCEFNVYNILSAILSLSILNYKNNLIQNVNTLSPVKGRFNIIKISKNKFCIIDYAHTPESLIKVLESVKSLSNFNIISLFSCPGNRDETKRKLMGEIAYNFSKKIIISTDNPKFENPLIIASEIKKGAKEKGVVIEDRKTAIIYAIKNLKENQVLLIIGKGTESYQDINNLKIPYSDYKTVYSCIKTLKNK